MTVPEAQERLEALTMTLASCANSPKQRGAIEVQMARAIGLSKEHNNGRISPWLPFATVLLEISENTTLNEQKATAIIAAASPHPVRLDRNS